VLTPEPSVRHEPTQKPDQQPTSPAGAPQGISPPSAGRRGPARGSGVGLRRVRCCELSYRSGAFRQTGAAGTRQLLRSCQLSTLRSES